MLQIRRLSKSYTSANAPLQILHNVSFELDVGKSLSIQGASGSGKSTLLHLLGALDTPDSGEIIVTPKHSQALHLNTFSESQADEYRRKHVGFVFQKFNLIDCLTVSDNILLPSRLNRLSTQNHIAQLADSMQISQHLNKYPNQLSGGEQQRVAIARALLHQPSLILADEPTGNLDESTSQIVSTLLFDTCRELGTSLIVVTHSDKVARQADEQLKMKHCRLEA